MFNGDSSDSRAITHRTIDSSCHLWDTAHVSAYWQVYHTKPWTATPRACRAGM